VGVLGVLEVVERDDRPPNMLVGHGFLAPFSRGRRIVSPRRATMGA
jgi:hypothetical protein